MREPTHYRCSKCGETFEIPEAVIETWREQSEAWGQVAFETKEVPHCPFCDSDDLQDETDPEDTDDSPPACGLVDTRASTVSAGVAGGESALNRVLVDIARSAAMREW